MEFNSEILELAGNYLIKNKLTLSVAESVTSGFIQAAFSGVTDSRKFFQGGITAYNIGQKAKHLNVEPIDAEATNCVSPKVASSMAFSVSRNFQSNIGISITGYAAPAPEIDVLEIFAFYSIVINNKEVASGKLKSTHKNPMDVQINYTNQLTELLYKALKNKK